MGLGLIELIKLWEIVYRVSECDLMLSLRLLSNFLWVHKISLYPGRERQSYTAYILILNKKIFRLFL